jgi:primosomal protein N' (replication factor Y)
MFEEATIPTLTKKQFDSPSTMFAEVAVPLRVTQTFTYRLGESIAAEAAIGSRVIVPLGKSKQVTGYIVALHTSLPADLGIPEEDVKPVEELLDAEPLLTPEVIDLTKWVADYYAAPWGEVLKAALPAGINAAIDQVLVVTDAGRDAIAHLREKSSETAKARILRAANENEITLKEASGLVGASRAQTVVRELKHSGLLTVHHRTSTNLVKAKRRKIVRLLDPPAETAGSKMKEQTEAQERIIEALKTNGGEMLFTALVDRADASASTIQTLSKRGLLEVYVGDVRRDPLAHATLPDDLRLDLTAAQDSALKEVTESLAAGEFKTFLLHGVTGSGKTEVYIRAMRAALDLGRTAMMLVPEIALTPVFSRRLRAHFGDDVAIFHSSLSPGERFDEWNRLKRGEAKLVIGTRSAVFAPVSGLGVIVIDEEHDTSYRQQESPYYNGRDTAIVRASKESAVVILGSATPSMESFHNAKKGKYRYLRLPSRINDRAMARAELIDMRELPGKTGRPEAFSQQLLTAIQETHQNGDQSIILLNRRGYSSFVLCRSCGESIQCVNCDVTLTYHREEAALVCHYCNYRRAAPSKCPSCGGLFIYFVGEGTEQLEEILHKHFPSLTIARVDRDTMSRHRSFEETLLRFGSGEIDMLVGTQMLAKGHDYPNVTLVGVVSVDAGLALPDFRSAERTFQLITQVAGRAGRGEREGRVLIQTYHPEHYALKYACAQDYDGFYEEEIRHRRNLNFPPFVALAAVLVHEQSFMAAQSLALELRHALDRANLDRACKILGPAPAPLARLRNEHRIQLLLKSVSRQSLRQTIDRAVEDATATGLSLHNVNIEIDPVNLM